MCISCRRPVNVSAAKVTVIIWNILYHSDTPRSVDSPHRYF
jgi:hypothetical protein